MCTCTRPHVLALKQVRVHSQTAKCQLTPFDVSPCFTDQFEKSDIFPVHNHLVFFNKENTFSRSELKGTFCMQLQRNAVYRQSSLRMGNKFIIDAFWTNEDNWSPPRQTLARL